MKRPDRFERLVLKALAIPDGPQGVVGVWLTGAEVVALLRKEHRAVVRLVKAQPAALHGVFIRRDSLLAALKRRAR